MLSAIALSAASCIESNEVVAPGEGITFDVATVETPKVKAAGEQEFRQEILVSEDNRLIVATCQSEDMKNLEQEVETRATRYNSEEEFAAASQTFKVWGWNTSSSNAVIFTDETVSKTSGKWKPVNNKTWKFNTEYCFEALYPGTTGLTAFTTDPEPANVSFSYTLPTGAGAAYDYMLAYYKGIGNNEGKALLTFTHPFTCVKFAAAEGLTVNSIKIEGLYAAGSCAVTKSTCQTGDCYTYDWTPGTADHAIECEIDDELILIPQNLADDNVKLTVNVTVDGVTFNTTATLNADNWLAGKINTYTFNISGQDVQITVTDDVEDKVKDNLVIKNTGTSKAYVRASIVAGWYDEDGMMVAPWDPASGTFTGLTGADWKLVGDYYYYQKPVLPGTSTGSALFTKYEAPATAPVEGAHLEMTILAQGVIWDSEQARVKFAWGVTTVESAELK